ncbi:class I SAM-dependent methyltransferase [Helicobacter sp. 23-1045]
MKILNIACGSRISLDKNHIWENIDFSPLDKRVKKVNLLKKLPYPNETFDVAYSSHFLEHLTKENALLFLREVRRVMKKGGILRIVVPDLENAVNEYLNILKKLRDRGGAKSIK